MKWVGVLKDRAFAHAAQGMDLSQTDDRNESFVRNALVGGYTEMDQCWTLLRLKYPGEAKSEALKRLQSIRDGSVTTDALGELVAASEDPRRWNHAAQARLPEMLHTRIVKELNGAAPTEEQRAELDRLIAMLPIPYSGSDAAKRAEFLVDTNDAESAVAGYGRQWERDKSQPLPLYLQGLALRRAGREAEAKRAIDLAHFMPLGQVFEREQLAKDLSDRGFTAEAGRERDVLLLMDRSSAPTDAALRATASAAWTRSDFDRAAALFEQSIPGLCQLQFQLYGTANYFTVAHNRHQIKAEGFLAAGNADEAMRELRVCQSLLHVVELPVKFAAKLESLGHREDATELVQSTADVFEANLALFPDSPVLHNQLAWLLAKCHRRLDESLQHARKAVAIAPGRYDYLDTLAEALFHTGDRAGAVGAATKALAAVKESKGPAASRAEARRVGFEKDPLPAAADERE